MGQSLSDMCHLAQTVISPGQAKNVLTVGSSKNVQDGTDRLSWFSGKGPTPDGRFKPDVVAVGEIFSAMSSSGEIGDSASDCETIKNRHLDGHAHNCRHGCLAPPVYRGGPSHGWHQN
jgi:hypothetical protein